MIFVTRFHSRNSIRLYCTENANTIRTPRKNIGYWDNKENVMQFLKEIKTKLNLKTPKDWNLLTQKNIKSLGGSRLLLNYTMFELKTLGCPEVKEIYYNQKKNFKKPKSYEINSKTLEKFIEKLTKEYNLKSENDWKNLTKKQILIQGGIHFLEKYSLNEIIVKAFPNIKEIKSKKSPGYWENEENIQVFLNILREKFNLVSTENWNQITKKQIIENGGSGLLKYYNTQEIKCLGSGDEFKSSNCLNKPKGYWENKKNVIKFLQEIQVKLNLINQDDWNNLSKRKLCSLGGSQLCKIYSMFEIKSIGCPEIAENSNYSKLGRNNKKIPGYWNNLNNVKLFLEELGNKYNLRSIDDWKRISYDQIHSLGGSYLLSKYTLKQLIYIANPDLFKEFDTFSSKLKKTSQRWLFLQIQKLFPNEEIVEDYFHEEITRNSGYSIQFDIFMINKKIAFEYHGKQHFEDIPSFGPLELYELRDKEKGALCNKFGVYLVIVPYWWNKNLDSLWDIVQKTLPPTIVETIKPNLDNVELSHVK